MSATKPATPNAASATTSSRPAAMPNAAEATRMMEDAVRGWGDAMNTWFDAQHRMMTAAMASMPKMPAVESCMPTGEMRRTAEEMGSKMRGSANRVFHGTMEIATTNMNEMATMLNEQSRFVGRLAERAADCTFGDHAACTPEAFSATVRAMMTDCVENTTASSEQMVRSGARTMDAVRTMAEGEVAANAPTTASR